MRALIAAGVAVLSAPALACHVGAATTGTLPTQPTGNIYGSDLGGLPAALTVSNIPALEPAYHVSVTAPAISAWGNGFNLSGATVQIAYTAIGTGVAYSQAFTSTPSGFDAPAIAAAVVMTFQSRILSSSGFTMGNYGTQVTVTCG